MSKDEQLKSKTIFGFLWSFTELVSKQGIQIIIQIILARLLLPEHFGLIGMITIFIAISTAFVQSGLDQALIREQNPGKEDFSTVFYFNLAISIFVYVVLYLCAPIVADFYNEPRVVEILRVIMVVVIFNAFAVIQRVILIRKVDFKTQTKISIAAGILSGSTAVVMAIMGWGVWSLVAQQLIMKFVEMMLLIVNNRWIPALKFNINLFKKYFNFGYKLLLSGLLDQIYKNIYFVIIGKFYPVAQLGYFTKAKRLGDVSSQSVSQAIQKVTYPVLSSIQEDSERLSANFKKLLKMIAFFNFPFMLGIAAIAPNLIPFLLGEQWMPSVLYFQLLCIAFMLYPLHAINLNILKVKNRSDLFLLLEVIKKSVLTLLIILAIILDFGIEGLIFAIIANSFISLVVNTYYSAKEIQYSFFNQAKDILPSFVLAGVMSIIVYHANNIYEIHVVINLVIQILLGFVLYVGISWVLKLDEFTMAIKLLKNTKRK